MLCLEKLVAVLLKTQRTSDAYKKGPWKSQQYTVSGSRYSGEAEWDGRMLRGEGIRVDFPILHHRLTHFSLQVFANVRIVPCVIGWLSSAPPNPFYSLTLLQFWAKAYTWCVCVCDVPVLFPIPWELLKLVLFYPIRYFIIKRL